MNNAEWVGKWAGRKVSVYEGPHPFVWDFNENEFPWLCEKTNELEFVVPDWNTGGDGDWEVVHVGINLKDLISSFIDTEEGLENKAEALERRRNAIAALQEAIDTLKTAPIQTPEQRG